MRVFWSSSREFIHELGLVRTVLLNWFLDGLGLKNFKIDFLERPFWPVYCVSMSYYMVDKESTIGGARSSTKL